MGRGGVLKVTYCIMITPLVVDNLLRMFFRGGGGGGGGFIQTMRWGVLCMSVGAPCVLTCVLCAWCLVVWLFCLERFGFDFTRSNTAVAERSAKCRDCCRVLVSFRGGGFGGWLRFFT